MLGLVYTLPGQMDYILVIQMGIPGVHSKTNNITIAERSEWRRKTADE